MVQLTGSSRIQVSPPLQISLLWKSSEQYAIENFIALEQTLSQILVIFFDFPLNFIIAQEKNFVLLFMFLASIGLFSGLLLFFLISTFLFQSYPLSALNLFFIFEVALFTVFCVLLLTEPPFIVCGDQSFSLGNFHQVVPVLPVKLANFFSYIEKLLFWELFLRSLKHGNDFFFKTCIKEQKPSI